MSLSNPVRPMAGLKQAIRRLRAEKYTSRRSYATTETPSRHRGIADFHPGNIYRGHREQEAVFKPIPAHPPPPSAKSICPDPMAAFRISQTSILDPTGVRTRLFSKANDERAKVGDIILIRLRNGDPFAGVALNIRHQGIDTAVLLRNQLTRVGVEMWYKIYSPNVEGIEIVQRRESRARRARLYYMRQPKHDVGSVENIVRQYLRQRAMLRSSETKGRDANAGKKRNNKRGSN